jgi:hypothetical protein
MRGRSAEEPLTSENRIHSDQQFASDIHLHDIATRAYADGFSHHLARVFLSNKTIFVSGDSWLFAEQHQDH